MFSGDISKLVENAVDAAYYKQQVITNNIANIQTPGYKAKTVEFGIVLDNQMKVDKNGNPSESGSEGSYRKARLGVYTYNQPNTRMELDGNNVDIDKERIALADVQYQYSALIDYMNAGYMNIRTALNRN
ncbi:MAG: flagellar basal body rod protein FlgB [Ruminococcus sp.]|nr:flagellar basal body rod protein FlgB [Ruminococcus sp.]